jgi:hypothetical protein
VSTTAIFSAVSDANGEYAAANGDVMAVLHTGATNKPVNNRNMVSRMQPQFSRQ